MRAFLWVMAVLFVIEIFGKAIILHRQDDRRNLAIVPFDLLCEVGLLIWTVSLLTR